MTDNREQPPNSCRWCDGSMLPPREYAKGVCIDCYRLLHSAGITDEEIFASTGED